MIPDPRVLAVQQRIAEIAAEMPLRASRVHTALLENRRQSLQQFARLIAMQVEAAHPGPAAPSPKAPPLFDYADLVEFGTGSLARCLGPDFNVFDGRRVPRIPNGDLLLMSRVVTIDGTRLNFKQPSTIVVEYDVPADAWYMVDNAYPFMPCSVLMEIALQPCGFLTAYMGSTLPHAEEDFYFRNLDGQSRITREVDTRGQTITTRATMVSTVYGSGTIIQKFTYELSLPDGPFYEGEAVFGFFSPETMANQVGLDSGKALPPWIELPEAAASDRKSISLVNDRKLFEKRADRPQARLSDRHLDLLDDLVVVSRGGKYQQGYVYAQKPLSRDNWFFDCHFFQDPVMPGSLGVEAVYQAIQAFALSQNLDASLASPHFSLAANLPFNWKYRGQITPNTRLLRLEAHISKIETAPGRITVTADASLWADAVRIYELKNVGLNLSQG